MIVEDLKIFSQNILTLRYHPYSRTSLVRNMKIPSSSSYEGELLMGSNHHPNWMTFARIPSNDKDFPRVLVYINIRLSALRFLLQKDIFNYRDVSLILFFNNNICFYILNIYSDSSHSVLKYLKDTKVNINNVVLITGDFNIRDILWDSTFPFHSFISDDLITLADSFNLAFSSPTNPCLTRYSDTPEESNSVIDLMFLSYDSSKLDQHSILPESCLFSDHAPLIVTIPLSEEFIQNSRLILASKSDQESKFISDVISNFKDLDMTSIEDTDKLD